jgi:hypothetical protein
MIVEKGHLTIVEVEGLPLTFNGPAMVRAVAGPPDVIASMISRDSIIGPANDVAKRTLGRRPDFKYESWSWAVV